jgi:hypothetical protein
MNGVLLEVVHHVTVRDLFGIVLTQQHPNRRKRDQDEDKIENQNLEITFFH